MTTTRADIESRVISIIAKCSELSSEKLEPIHWEGPLTGSTFDLFAVDLIYILFEIEKEFHIQIQPDALEQYGFSSINRISSVVQAALEQL